MCGIIGIYGRKDCITELYDGLLCIQHRGQDAAGVITYNSRFYLKKGFGLVKDVFKEKHILRLKGKIGIGHVRYPTVGTGSKQDAQPFYVNTPYGIAMAHNGNVTNFLQLKKELLDVNLRHLNSSCDVEVVLNVFADALLKQNTKKLKPEHIFKAVETVYKKCKGSYSVVSIIGNKGLLIFRDPHGIKPLIMGEKGDKEKSYAAASESVALDILGYGNKKDVKPGEAIFIDENMKVHSKVIMQKEHTPCIFEYIYFARPDSFIDKISVYKTRLRLGEELAAVWKSTGLNADTVIPIPESSRTAASSLAAETDIKYREGFVKNRYIGRTFIMPDQAQRTASVRRKLNPIKLEFKDRDVLLVDDSIVRGTTSKQIIDMARNAGAKKVYFASCSAPLRYPCVYGIDMSTKGEFIATNNSVEKIEKNIGADKLIYQSVEAMIRAAQVGNPEIKRFCTACFTGDYPTGDVTKEMLDSIEEERKCAKRCC